MMMAMAWAICIIALVPVLVLAGECITGCLARMDRGDADWGDAPPIAVLVPAHNEARGIARCLAAVQAQLRPCDRLLVVADNCTDDTAAVARGLGAAVVERDDPARRGKGYALAFGRTALRDAPRAIVIVIDADCWPATGAIQQLAAAAAQRVGAAQGAYLLSPPGDASPLVRISCFAFLVKNLVRQIALDRWSGNALLQGSGMAFPWAMFEHMPLESGSLVEDLELGLALLLTGHDVRFVKSASFSSTASSQAATIDQRRRWEHGMMATVMRHLPRLIAQGVTHRPALLAIVADLMVPPTALLVSGAGFASIALLAITGLSMPALLLLSGMMALAVALAAAWRTFGTGILPARALTRLPHYYFWKLPILAQFVTHREQRWLRTSREP